MLLVEDEVPLAEMVRRWLAAEGYAVQVTHDGVSGLAAAYLIASQTHGMSVVRFQRQLGIARYETAFQILHKLRTGMVRPGQDRSGCRAKEHSR